MQLNEEGSIISSKIYDVNNDLGMLNSEDENASDNDEIDNGIMSNYHVDLIIVYDDNAEEVN